MLQQENPTACVKRGEDGDVQREYNRQRKHLERNVEALKSSIDKVWLENKHYNVHAVSYLLIATFCIEEASRKARLL